MGKVRVSKALLVFLAFFLIISGVNATITTSVTAPEGEDLGSTHTFEIKFNVTDSQGTQNVFSKISYSTTASAFENDITSSDQNLASPTDANLSCTKTGNNFDCSYTWGYRALSDDAYFIDINSASTDLNFDADSSSPSFNVDQTVPTVSILSPSGSALTADPHANLKFDLNDTTTSIGSVTVKIDAVESTDFSFPTDCTPSTSGEKNYTCTYTESLVNTSGTEYTLFVSAKDGSLNEASDSQTFTYTDELSPAKPATPSCTKSDAKNTVSWAKSSESDLKEYNVERKTTGDFSSVKVVSATGSECSGSDCSWEDTGVSNGTAYTYRIKSVDKSSNSSTASDESNSCTPQSDTDTSPPSKPTDLTITVESDGDFKIEWDASTDDESGISSYLVFEGKDSGFTLDDEIAEVSGTSFTRKSSDLDEGEKYYYVVKAKNGDGLLSDESEEVSADAVEGIKISVEAPKYATTNLFNIKITIVNGEIEDGNVFVRKAGESSYELIESDLSGSDFLVPFSFSAGEDGASTIRFEAVTDDGETFLESERVNVDTVVPESEFLAPLNNSVLKGNVSLKAKAIDDGLGIDFVRFSYGDLTKQFDVTESDDDEFSYDWDTTTVADGDYELTATAFDLAGNTVKTTLNVVVENASPEQKAATREKNKVDLTEEMFNDLGIPLPEDFIELKENANDEFFNENWNKSENLYKDLTKKFNVSEHDSAKFEFDESDLKNMLEKVLLSSDLIDETETLTKGNNVEREFVLFKVEENGQIFYKLAVRITIKNEGLFRNLKIVEIVPKEIIRKTNDLFSPNNFDVIMDDPVVEFTEAFETGEEKTIMYSLTSDLDSFSAGNLLQTAKTAYLSPPLIFSEDASFDDEDFAVQQFFDQALFFWGVIAVIILLILAALVFYFTRNSGGMLKGNPLESFLDKVHELRKGKGSGNDNKWSYRD